MKSSTFSVAWAALVWVWNDVVHEVAPADSRLSRFARLRNFPEGFLKSTGLMFLSIRMLES